MKFLLTFLLVASLVATMSAFAAYPSFQQLRRDHCRPRNGMQQPECNYLIAQCGAKFGIGMKW